MKKIIFIPFLVRALLKTLMLTAVIVTCNISVFAQLKNKLKQIPEGKWVLVPESVSAIKPGCNHGSFQDTTCSHIPTEINIEDVDIDIYPELQVKQDSILLVSPQRSIGAKYAYGIRTGITYDSPAIPFNPGGNVFGTRLFVQQRVNDPLDETSPIYVSFIYMYEKK